MLVKDVAKLTPMERLIYWIRERHAIYVKRRAGVPKPWTNDEVLRTWFFTNPYRENDKVTAWVRDNIRKSMENNPLVTFAIIAFRWFNWIPTGDLLKEHGVLGNWDTVFAVDRLSSFKAAGNQVFTGAFNISNSGSKKPKINRVCEDYIDPVWCDRDHLLTKGGTCASAASFLSTYPGLGGSGFMAAQIVCDLKYTHVLRDASDWWTWSSPGPGSRKGMNLALGYGEDCRLSMVQWHACMERVRKAVNASRSVPELHAQDVQNCLCEFFKYERARMGGGSKRRYPGA